MPDIGIGSTVSRVDIEGSRSEGTKRVPSTSCDPSVPGICIEIHNLSAPARDSSGTKTLMTTSAWHLFNSPEPPSMPGVAALTARHIRGLEVESSIIGMSRGIVKLGISALGIGGGGCQYFSSGALRTPQKRQKSPLFYIAVMLFLMTGCANALCNPPDCAPPEGWDNFANNFGSDMAPLLALFGEQVTKQYISESMDWVDNLLLAIAPLGIITTMIAAIRVAGSSMLRSLIGRAKETRGDVEADLMSSTSTDVCELWSGESVVRVIGRPLLLQLAYVKSQINDPGRKAGIYDFRDEKTKTDYYRRARPQNSLGGNSSQQRNETLPSLTNDDRFYLSRNPPNVSLNMSLQPLPRGILITFVLIGVVLQLGVLAFAAVSQYTLHLPKNDTIVPGYAFPVLLIGTISLAVGIFLCAQAVDTSTTEIAWQPLRPDISVLWLQKGGQKVGDQQFESFARQSEGRVLTSHREHENIKSRSALVTVAVIITLMGFIAQFFALRAAHSSITLLQLATVLIMTGLRSLARRHQDNENKIQDPQQVEDFELDWLAKHLGGCKSWEIITGIGASSINRDSEGNPVVHASPSTPNTQTAAENPAGGIQSAQEPQRSTSIVEKVGGISTTGLVPPSGVQEPSAEAQLVSGIPTSRNDSNDREYTPSEVLQARARLAVLSDDWDLEARKTVKMLQSAIEKTINDVFPSMIMKDDGKNTPLSKTFHWGVPIKTIYTDNTEQSLDVDLTLTRETEDVTGWTAWKADRSELEAVLCLWVSSLSEVDRMREKNVEEGLKNVRLIGPATEAGKVDYKVWIHRGATHEEIQLKPETERYFGWTARYSTQPIYNDSYISVDTECTMEVLCAQQLYALFLNALALRIKGVGGETTRRLGDSTAELQVAPAVKDNDWAHFSLKNTTLASIATIFSDCGLGTVQEAYFCIIPSFEAVEKPPCPHEAYKMAQKISAELSAKQEWEKSAEIDRWLHSVSGTTNAPQHIVKATEAEISGRLRQLTLTMASNFAESKISGSLKMWNTAYSQYQMVSPTMPPENLSLGLVLLCMTRQRLKGDDDHKELCRLISDTILSLNPDASPEDTISTVEAAGKDIFQDEESLTRFIWANAIKPWDDIQALEEKSPSMVLITARQLIGDMLCSNTLKKYLSDPRSLSVAAKTSALEGITREEVGDDSIPIDLLLIRGYRTPLQIAAETGDVVVVQGLLGAGAPINAEPAPCLGRTALQAASENGHLEIINLLVDSGAHINAPAGRWLGRTALQAAAGAGKKYAVERLLSLNAEINALPAKYSGRTALQAAAQCGDTEIVERLLERNAAVNAPAAHSGRTAMQAAAEGGHIDIVKLLLDHGAEIEAMPADDCGRTALQAAAEGGHMDVVKFLLNEGAKVDTPPSPRLGRTALQAAAGAGKGDVVELLLMSRADVNAEPAHDLGRTALQAAVEGGHYDVVKRLLEAGGEVNADVAEKSGISVLQAALGNGSPEIVKLVLTATFDLEHALHLASTAGQDTFLQDLLHQEDLDANKIEPSDGSTPLIRAAEKGHTEVVQWLVKRKEVDVNLQGTFQFQCTPLVIAAEHGQEAVFDLLLAEPRVDMKIRTNRGASCLSMAARNGHSRICKKLLETPGIGSLVDYVDRNGETPLLLAAMRGQRLVVQQLLARADVNVNYTDRNGCTPLFLASQYGHESVVQLLLEDKRVDIHLCTPHGCSALLVAAECNHAGVVAMLLHAPGSEALLNLADKDGTTPIWCAAFEGNQTILQEFLARKDILVNIHDEDGLTPLLIAAKNGHTEAVKQLLSVKGIDVDYENEHGQTALSVAMVTEIRDLLQAHSMTALASARTAGSE